MKKKTVITTEKFEVWFTPQPSDVPASVAQAPEADTWKPESSNESLTSVPEEHRDKDVPLTHKD